MEWFLTNGQFKSMTFSLMPRFLQQKRICKIAQWSECNRKFINIETQRGLWDHCVFSRLAVGVSKGLNFKAPLACVCKSNAYIGICVQCMCMLTRVNAVAPACKSENRPKTFGPFKFWQMFNLDSLKYLRAKKVLYCLHKA